MDDEADAAREYERLRAELADFVLDALAERIAAGQEPRLSQALVEAIDRRVDEAVAARIGRTEWPDPDAFADSVIAAAAGRGGDGAAARARRADPAPPRSRREPPPREPRLKRGHWIMLALIAVAIIAAATYFFLNRTSGPVKTESSVNGVDVITFAPPEGNGANAQQPPPGNASAPTSAGAVQNVQGPTP